MLDTWFDFFVSFSVYSVWFEGTLNWLYEGLDVSLNVLLGSDNLTLDRVAEDSAEYHTEKDG